MCLRLFDPPEDLCTTAGTGKQTDFVCQYVNSYDTLTVLLPVLPLKTGWTKFTVQLRSQFGGDDVVQEIKVEVGYFRLVGTSRTGTVIYLQPEGVLREYDYSNELDPQGTFTFP